MSNSGRSFIGEPLKHLFLVHGHPVDVGLGSLQRLLKSHGGRAQLTCVVFFELQQLERNGGRGGYWDSILHVEYKTTNRYKQNIGLRYKNISFTTILM